MGSFDDETAIEPIAAGNWAVMLSPAWNIGAAANGGYAISPVVRALATLGPHADPLSLTTHYLRPVELTEPTPAEVRGLVVRAGRTTTATVGSLTVAGRERLTVAAVFGDLDEGSESPELTVPPPDISPPADCVDRAVLTQGVELPILQRLDVRIDPARSAAGGSPDAVIDGWIRFADGSDAGVTALPLFCDAFPPSLYPRFGRIGWVPTIELTVHVRRRPTPGWVQARLECDDLHDGRMIETGSLWDSTGALVARSRQLGLLLSG